MKLIAKIIAYTLLILLLPIAIPAYLLDEFVNYALDLKED